MQPAVFDERAVKLELQDAREEVARVGRVVRHVVLRAGVEELLAARRRGRNALILQPQRPTTPCCSRPASPRRENTFQRH